MNDTTFPLPGTQVSTITAPLSSTGYHFTHWTLAGVRQNNGTGSGANPVSFTITAATEAIAYYTLEAQDSDADTLPDWYEIHHFGSLTQGANDDFDGDGFTNALELSIGQHPGAHDEREQGGVSRRRGLIFNVAPGVGDPTYIYSGVSRRRGVAFNTTLFALPPAIGSIVATSVTAPSARLHALVNPIGSATMFVFQYGITTAYGHNTLLRPAGNGRLAAAAYADIGGLMPDTDYHFRVIATNARGTTTSEDAIFHTLADAYYAWAAANAVGGPTADDDRDGLLNGVEFAFSLNPHLSDLDRLPAPIIVNGRYRLDFQMPAGVTGVSVSAEYSTDLETWIALPDYCVGRHHTFNAPLGSERQYVRWLVQFAP